MKPYGLARNRNVHLSPRHRPTEAELAEVDERRVDWAERINAADDRRSALVGALVGWPAFAFVLVFVFGCVCVCLRICLSLPRLLCLPCLCLRLLSPSAVAASAAAA